MIAQGLQRSLRVSLRVPVSDHHRHVFADALRAERGGRERGRHREEVDGAAVLAAQDRRELGPGDVDAVDDQVGQLRQRRRQRGDDRQRIARVGDDQVIDVPVVLQQLRSCRLRARHDPDDDAARTDAFARLRAGEDSGFSVGADHADGAAAVGEPPHLRRRAGDVEHGQRDAGRQVVRQPGVDPGLEQNRRPAHADLTRQRVDALTGQVGVRGTAILFETGIYARLPDDLPTGVALAVLDVAGAPAQVRRLADRGRTVCVIGADGKSGILACAQARERVGPSGVVVGIVPSAETAGAKLLQDHGYVDHLVVADARDALAIIAALPAALPELADLVVNCVNVAGTELASILCCKDGGTVYFFSMATSFTAAALGAEGVGKDVTMMVGNGYAKGHAQTALQTLRDHPAIADYFVARYGACDARETSP